MLATASEIECKLDKIIENLDKLPRHERLSSMENDVEVLVKQFRDSLNEEIIDKINQKVSTQSPVPCGHDHNFYSMGFKKKIFS